MIALLRYTFLKSSRDHMLAGFLAGPAVLIAAPILGIAAVSLVRGRFRYPITPDFKITAEATAIVIAHAGAIVATIAAGLAAFSILRAEVANRSMALFVLAARPRTIVTTAAVYGTAIGIASFLIALAVALLTTAQVPPGTARLLLHVVEASLASAALGAALVAFSADLGMAVPVYLVSMGIGGTLAGSKGYVTGLSSLVITILLLATASFVLERRCTP